MTLSVIIVNYNVRQFLENALASVSRALEGIDGEVFVVDNASSDGSAEMVRAKFPRVCLIESERNVGFARANNMALRRARGEFLLLLNPDTVVQEDTFSVMLRFFADVPDAGLAGCKILNPDGTFQLPCRRSFPTPWVAFTKIFGLSALFPKSRLFGRYNLTYLDEDETYPVEAIGGAFMMLRREAYEKAGGLDESFFMYGEDLDWCYRIGQAGYRVYYVHATKIIHFKGESTKRSDIDEIKHFYEAMQLFVRKHFGRSRTVRAFLSLGINLRGAAASLVRLLRPLRLALPDAALTVGALIAAEYLHWGRVFRFPSYAYPLVWIVPAALIVMLSGAAGVYTTSRNSVLRSFLAVAASYVLVSAIVFFEKDFAFSRAVVIIAGTLSLVLLPGWRLALMLFGRGGTRSSVFGRRTLIVGTGPSAQKVLRKLRVRVDDGYDVVGFIDTSMRRIGEKVAGVEIVGSIDNVGKVIDEHRIGEVIFSTDGLSFETILSVIARSRSRSLNFRLVPGSLESIIGKTSIDELDTLPLVDIEYNIHHPVNRFVKRATDLALGLILLVTAYPAARLRGRNDARVSPILRIPDVVRGDISLVGLPAVDGENRHGDTGRVTPARDSYLGPEGLTGLVQIHERQGLDPEERERYKLYYAKNQSLLLDMQIMLRSLFRRR
ncbi:MAG TPA: glycosyltransferase [Bacteroidota bacterium]|nr:glycosyltransferase [Bacteroidota bacterium]